MKRITTRINEAQRRAENAQTVANLEARVEDWKGHHLSNFGELVLEDVFMVMKMDIDREYHVFLFEKIILCCKEVVAAVNGGSVRKSSKNSYILKKQAPSFPGGAASSRKKSTPLLLKGRIFLNNVTHTRHSITPGSCIFPSNAALTRLLTRNPFRSDDPAVLTAGLVARRR